ncbi:dihydropteroate synthase [Altererythrobacter endophyticus]|uniref:dihydropteroate synthase n=2 Tax=Altericroceibacterium endophyticum TaxID=1808508 RepID=A0A6I4SZV8_9SPHN|nr:dihydropteroate synthase [Altericroceibacterium endophyticum]MXO64237.1 dihydropteroate synthase [Altericroceibacterium endophyticum]
MARIYLCPTGFCKSPQAEHGDALRLAGGMVYVHRFAVIIAEAGRVVQRHLASPASMPEVLAKLPAELAAEAEEQWANLSLAHPPLQCGDRIIRLDQPQIMGILNVTPDSFSDGGQFLGDDDVARAHAGEMLSAGAAILDIGGESTRPGADPVWEGDEIKRVVPAVEFSSAMGAAISVDTRRPAVMEAAQKAGAHIYNDVSALRHDPRSLEFAAASGLTVVLMHAPGSGDNLHEGADYNNVVFDVFEWLRERRDAAIEAGVRSDRIILDPGLGFGKSLSENLALMNNLALFHALGHPLLLGVSRKRMIGALSKEAPAHDRLGGSLALAIAGMNAGCQLLRVHDVAETAQARDVWRGQRDAALTDFTLND